MNDIQDMTEDEKAILKTVLDSLAFTVEGDSDGQGALLLPLLLNDDRATVLKVLLGEVLLLINTLAMLAGSTPAAIIRDIRADQLGQKISS